MVISALGRPREKEYQKFEVSLGYIDRTKPTALQSKPYLKTQSKAHNPKSLKMATTMQVSK